MRIPARQGFPALSRPLVLILLRIEVVASIPSVVWTASMGHNDTRAESSEGSNAIRERADSRTGIPVECATSHGPVRLPNPEHDVAVQHAGGNPDRLVIVDLRAGRDLGEVG